MANCAASASEKAWLRKTEGRNPNRSNYVMHLQEQTAKLCMQLCSGETGETAEAPRFVCTVGLVAVGTCCVLAVPGAYKVQENALLVARAVVLTAELDLKSSSKGD